MVRREDDFEQLDDVQVKCDAVGAKKCPGVGS